MSPEDNYADGPGHMAGLVPLVDIGDPVIGDELIPAHPAAQAYPIGPQLHVPGDLPQVHELKQEKSCGHQGKHHQRDHGDQVFNVPLALEKFPGKTS